MNRLKITLKRSLIGCTQGQKAAAYCLGLKKTGQQILLKSNPVVMGQVNKIKHLLDLKQIVSKGNIKRKTS